MARRNIPLLQGTLDVMILKALSTNSMHGYGVAIWLEQCTDDVLQIEEGSLYPALHRMQRKGWLSADGTTEERILRRRMLRWACHQRTVLRWRRWLHRERG